MPTAALPLELSTGQRSQLRNRQFPEIWGCSYGIHRPWRTLHSRPGLGLAAVSITPEEGVARTTIFAQSAWLAPERQLGQHWLVTDGRWLPLIGAAGVFVRLLSITA